MSREAVIRGLYSFSEAFALPFEKTFRPEEHIQFTSEHRFISYACVAAYLIIVFQGKAFMEKREAFDLRGPLAVWNGFLSLFSTIGMFRTVSKNLNVSSTNPHIIVLTYSLRCHI